MSMTFASFFSFLVFGTLLASNGVSSSSSSSISQLEGEQQQQDQIHVAVLSDRFHGLTMALGSLCSSAVQAYENKDQYPNQFVFHILLDDKDSEENELNKDASQDAKKHTTAQDLEAVIARLCPKSAQVRFFSLEETLHELTNVHGFALDWRHGYPYPGADKDHRGVETPFVHEKHHSAQNLLRFYLPHVQTFQGVEKLIFLDDDVVIQKDIAELWNHQPQDLQQVSMVSGCQHWKWDESHRDTKDEEQAEAPQFRVSSDLSVRETGYMGALSVPCAEKDSYMDTVLSCTRPHMEEDLSKLSVKIDDAHSPFVGHPLDRRAFNMGFTVFYVPAWKTNKISEKFEAWVKSSLDVRLFRPDSLAFGLGLGYLAIGDSFECLEDTSDIVHLTGLSFVDDASRTIQGYTMDKIAHDISALHFNGSRKPWDNAFVCPANSVATSVEQIWQKTCVDLNLCTCIPKEEEMELAETVKIPSSPKEEEMERAETVKIPSSPKEEEVTRELSSTIDPCANEYVGSQYYAYKCLKLISKKSRRRWWRFGNGRNLREAQDLKPKE